MPQSDIEVWARLAEEYHGLSGWRFTKAYDALFDGIDLKGKAVLDIGGGIGLASTYSLVRGASHAVLLEPEADGSGKRRLLDEAHKLRDTLELGDRFTVLGRTFQDYDSADQTFDVVISEASINHIDEEAVVSLLESEAARKTYSEVIGKLASLLRPGAMVIIGDAARRNFFGDLGLRNPFAPSIEWYKHQQPQTWIRLFEEHGFSHPKVRWGKHTTLGSAGRLLLGNAVAFYFLSSYFILTMRYKGNRSAQV